MGDIVNFVTQNWATIGEAILAVIGAASVIVKLTPTPKDDAFVAKLKKFVSKYLALNPNE